MRSADPAEAPRILFNLLAEPEAAEAMVRAIELTRRIYAQAPLGELIRRETLPGADTDLREHLRRHAGHRSHPVGTCRMGVGRDAVVDAELRVHGIEGLRIADASVMPALPSGNTNLPTMMIGEKAADLIRGQVLPAVYPERRTA